MSVSLSYSTTDPVSENQFGIIRDEVARVSASIDWWNESIGLSRADEGRAQGSTNLFRNISDATADHYMALLDMKHIVNCLVVASEKSETAWSLRLSDKDIGSIAPGSADETLLQFFDDYVDFCGYDFTAISSRTREDIISEFGSNSDLAPVQPNLEREVHPNVDFGELRRSMYYEFVDIIVAHNVDHEFVNFARGRQRPKEPMVFDQSFVKTQFDLTGINFRHLKRESGLIVRDFNATKSFGTQLTIDLGTLRVGTVGAMVYARFPNHDPNRHSEYDAVGDSFGGFARRAYPVRNNGKDPSPEFRTGELCFHNADELAEVGRLVVKLYRDIQPAIMSWLQQKHSN